MQFCITSLFDIKTLNNIATLLVYLPIHNITYTITNVSYYFLKNMLIIIIYFIQAC